MKPSTRRSTSPKSATHRIHSLPLLEERTEVAAEHIHDQANLCHNADMNRSSGTSSRPSSSWHSAGWWTSVGGIAGIAGVGIAIAAWLYPFSSDDQGHAASPLASASSNAGKQDSASQSAKAPAPSASLPDTSNDILYTGSVRIAEAGPQLDYKPPKIDAFSGDARLGTINPPTIFTEIGSGPTLALWSEQKTPTRQQCSDLISTQGISRVEVRKGTLICLKTQAGRIAVLTITSTSNSFNTGVMAHATVWSEISD